MDTNDLDTRAAQCSTQADRIDGIISDLDAGSKVIFNSWTGNPADDLRSGIEQSFTALHQAQDNLRNAAAAFRDGAAAVKVHPKK